MGCPQIELGHAVVGSLLRQLGKNGQRGLVSRHGLRRLALDYQEPGGVVRDGAQLSPHLIPIRTGGCQPPQDHRGRLEVRPRLGVPAQYLLAVADGAMRLRHLELELGQFGPGPARRLHVARQVLEAGQHPAVHRQRLLLPPHPHREPGHLEVRLIRFDSQNR
jgi:hypothetical protein